MIRCKIYNPATKEVWYRNFRFKQYYEIEAMCKANKWLLVSWSKEL